MSMFHLQLYWQGDLFPVAAVALVVILVPYVVGLSSFFGVTPVVVSLMAVLFWD